MSGGDGFGAEILYHGPVNLLECWLAVENEVDTTGKVSKSQDDDADKVQAEPKVRDLVGVIRECVIC